MDRRALLAKFVEVTGSDPGLAEDLLAGKQWNWAAAMNDYNQLTGNFPTNTSTSTPAVSAKPSQTANASSQGTAPRSAPATRQPVNSNQPFPDQPGHKDQPQQQRAQIHPQLQPLPEHQVVQPGDPTSETSSVSNHSVGGSSTSGGSSVPSSRGNGGREVSSRPSPQLTLFIPKADESDGQRSPAPTKKLQRGISKANCALVDLSRKRVTEDEQDHAHHLEDTPMYTFILPDLSLFPADFRAFIEKDLLELTTMVNLEHAGRLNWWAETNACARLWPMATTGDGNCLLHAASLGMWGFHDRQLTLRKALYYAVTENPHSPRMQRLKRRWRWQQTETNRKSGLVYSEAEWEDEWKGLLRLASAEPRTPQPGGSKGSLPPLAESKPPVPTDDGEELTYESLEEFHVFVLAHILRRPIIVVSDTMLRDADGEAFAPISFGGIYLPLEVPYKDCEASPLVLTYDSAHFSALVPMEQTVEDYEGADNRTSVLPVVIPITDCDHRLLPVHFAVDPGPTWQWNKTGNRPDKSLSTTDKLKLLHQYLNLVKIPIDIEGSREDSLEQERLSPTRSSNGLRAKVSSNNPMESDKLDKGRNERGSFGRKLKYFAKLERHKNGSTAAREKNVPLSERKIGPITRADLEDPTIIVGAKMSERRHQLQEEMIKNYLDKAKERFEEDRRLKRLLKEENRQWHEQLAASRLPPPRSWDDSHINSREAYSDDLLSPGFHRQGQGYPNRQPSPEVYRRYNQQPTHLNVYQPPLTYSRSNPIPQPVMIQPQHPQLLLSSHSSARPASYQYGYQLDAPAETTVLVNQVNVQPRHQASRQPAREDRPGTVGQLIQGMHQLQPSGVYQQSPLQSVPQGSQSPQIARSTNVVSQLPHQSTSLSPHTVPVDPWPPQTAGLPQVPRSPQSPPLAQAPSSSQSPKASPNVVRSSKFKEPKNSKAKSKDKGTRPCKTKGCDFYGTESTNFLCSRCYESKMSKTSKPGRK